MPKPLLIEDARTFETWGQLYGCSLSLALAQLCEETLGVKLLITPDASHALQLKEELQFFLQKSSEIYFFPDWETLPYDQFSPHQDLISERLFVLNRLQATTNAIVIASTNTLMHRLAPPSFVAQHALALREGQTLSIEAFRNELQNSGYHAVNKVLEHGEYAIRGAIIDLYPMGSALPFRIELFDDTIESFRTFDKDTQRTIEKIKGIFILPAREFPMTPESIQQFRHAFRENFSGNPSRCPLYESVSNGQFPNGIEYYLPLFFEKIATFFDYLKPDATICFIDSVRDEAGLFWQEINTRYEQLRYDALRPILSPSIGFLSNDEFLQEANRFKKFSIQHDMPEKKKAYLFPVEKAPNLPTLRASNEPLANLRAFMTSAHRRYLLMVESTGRREVLLDLLKASDINPKIQSSWTNFLNDDAPVNIIISPVSEGCELPTLSIIVESQLFGEIKIPQRRPSQKIIDPNLIIRDLAELHIGAPVVHLQFGVGRYMGLQSIENHGTPNEFLVLAYAGDDKIYVPVTSLQLVSRYSGASPEHAPLHRLGSDQWQKEKKKAAEKIHDIAIELLDVYAKREAQPGLQYQIDFEEILRFASHFPFTETPDQIRAIHEIMEDMQKTRPMDRLICGDVGFGKTEVAMRAAFVAVQNNQQVCVLVPTTLLAQQHFQTFSDRFSEYPITIELLSRFRTTKESSTVVEKLKKGQIDIVIGTHKLFQKNIQFKQLGLLVIDEEHRFGVRQKEHIKALRTHVDILSMTATPIPRTLNMAMSGLRDISLISTPPAKRLAIKTFWLERHDALLREAILREIHRGGQVFFLHNNVETIQQSALNLQTLVPEAKVHFAHGQMHERELERIMSDFYHHRFQVLVCTTIIETGIDIPTANTIIIDRADKFGLAQLHQLRGRVGRSHHQAYAYLLTPPKKALSPDALKRLEAIVSLEDLGAGFCLATHDLEIRGAGELLGEDQSGNMHAIGFSLFMEMLEHAISDLKKGITPVLNAPMHQGPEIDFQLSTIIPEDYISDIHTRLIFYKRIANSKNLDELRELNIELIDRFGLAPESVKLLFLITELKLTACQCGVNRIIARGEHGHIDFVETPTIKTEVLIHLIQTQSKLYQLDGPSRLRFKLLKSSPKERILEVHQLLNQLS